MGQTRSEASSGESSISEWTTTLIDDIGLTKAPAKALTDECGSEEELVEFLREGHKPVDLDGVGDRSSSRVWDWFEDTHPEADRTRRENDEAYCMTYTTNHGLPDDETEDGTFYFAFVCPRCESKNPMQGDPNGFANRPYACTTCRYVPLLDAEALGEFRDEHYDVEDEDA